MSNFIRLHWTTLNCPLDNKTYYWEIGTIFDFHVEPINPSDKTNWRFVTKDNNIEPKTTKLIVTGIEDLGEQPSNTPRFIMTTYFFNDGAIEGDPIKIGYRTIISHLACWIKKVDSYMIKIPPLKLPVTYVNENGHVFIDK